MVLYHVKIVLQNLLMDMMSFYSVYYILVSLCIGIFRVHEVDSLLAHFDYTTQPSLQSPKCLIYAWIVEEWVWDYAIPVKLIHIDLTVAGSGLVMMMEANDDGG
ncbi:putative transmembrane protein 244 [Salvelinus alpinus]